MARASLHGRILDAVESTITGLALDGVSSTNVVQAWIPNYENLKKFQQVNGLPAIFVCPFGTEGMDPNRTDTQADDVSYPVPVSIIAAADADLTLYIDKYLSWREALIGAFQNKRLSGVTEVHRCTVVPNSIVNIQALIGSQFWDTTITITATARKSRPS